MSSHDPDTRPHIATLAEAAQELARLNWPILPVRTPISPPRSADYLPAPTLTSTLTPQDPITAREWWSDGPYGIAAHTGAKFDVLVLPEHIGPHAIHSIKGCANLAARDPGGRWFMFVTPGHPPVPDIPRGQGVSMLRDGALVLLPPTPLGDGAMTWATGHNGTKETTHAASPLPDLAKVRFPHSLNTQWAAVRAFSIASNRR
jgi:hypothetical protein